jgi:hypothetical protein
VDDLLHRVHPGIGAPGADRLHRLTRDVRERGFEMVLHAAPGRLRLPPAECRAVVLHAQRDSHLAAPAEETTIDDDRPASLAQ